MNNNFDCLEDYISEYRDRYGDKEIREVMEYIFGYCFDVMDKLYNFRFPYFGVINIFSKGEFVISSVLSSVGYSKDREEIDKRLKELYGEELFDRVKSSRG